MDWNKIKQLKEKYWKGLSTPEEESLLKENHHSLEEETEVYFQQLNDFSKLTLPTAKKQQLLEKLEQADAPKRPKLRPVFLFKMAAVIVFCIGISFWLFQTDNKVAEPTKLPPISKAEQEKAFEITKQALMLVSTKLNKASKVTVALDKFGKAKAKIERKESSEK